MTDTPEKLENISFATATTSPSQPPVGIEPRPGQIVCGNIDMRIDVNGTWFYHGSPINRKKLVNLFSTVVRRDQAGDYWLITPAEMARIKVEDAPFLAVEMVVTNDNGVKSLDFRTNVEKWVRLDTDHPLRMDIDPENGEPRPYIRLAPDGTEARIVRSIFYDLVNMAEVTAIDGIDMLTIKSTDQVFVLGPASEDI